MRKQARWREITLPVSAPYEIQWVKRIAVLSYFFMMVFSEYVYKWEPPQKLGNILAARPSSLKYQLWTNLLEKQKKNVKKSMKQRTCFLFFLFFFWSLKKKCFSTIQPQHRQGSGGLVFELADEWWKDGSGSGLDFAFRSMTGCWFCLLHRKTRFSWAFSWSFFLEFFSMIT